MNETWKGMKKWFRRLFRRKQEEALVEVETGFDPNHHLTHRQVKQKVKNRLRRKIGYLSKRRNRI